MDLEMRLQRGEATVLQQRTIMSTWSACSWRVVLVLTASEQTIRALEDRQVEGADAAQLRALLYALTTVRPFRSSKPTIHEYPIGEKSRNAQPFYRQLSGEH